MNLRKTNWLIFGTYLVVFGTLPVSQWIISLNRPVETGGAGGWGLGAGGGREGCTLPPQIFAKVDNLPVDNDSEKQK